MITYIKKVQYYKLCIKNKIKNFPKEIITIIIDYVSSFKLKEFKNFEGIYYIED